MKGEQSSNGSNEKTDLQKAYEIFGLEEDLSYQEVIKKYKKLALTYHSDSRSTGSSKLASEEKIAKFQEISWAYQIITINFLSEEQKDKEKDEIIEELRAVIAEFGVSNYYYVASLEELSKKFNKFQRIASGDFYGRIISSILVCCFFYFRRNKEEKENNKIVLLALIKYFLLIPFIWPLTLIILVWDIVSIFYQKKIPKPKKEEI